MSKRPYLTEDEMRPKENGPETIERFHTVLEKATLIRWWKILAVMDKRDEEMLKDAYTRARSVVDEYNTLLEDRVLHYGYDLDRIETRGRPPARTEVRKYD